MAPARVIKFTRSDDESGFVLLHATQKGSKPLDLKLIATEGGARYDATLKHDKVASLRVTNCPASESEWQTILDSLLRQEPLPDIQASATVQDESSISITIRKQIQSITQRLGAITLKYEPDEIDLCDWCATAADASFENKLDAASAAAKASDLEIAVEQLKTQLDELVKAKAEDETVLLHKFRDLLNEKKVKIREQQKILASKSFNASVPGSSQPSQQPAPPPAAKPARKPAQSRPTKRKAAAKIVEPEEEDDAGEMDVDKVKSEPEDTDPGDTEDTASIASDDDDDVAETEAPSPQKTKATLPPPPRRDLPFMKKKEGRQAPATASAGAGSETESDDEL